MSGVPGQTIHSFVDTLTRVTELKPEHISVYSLQVEEGTPLSKDKELLRLIPDEISNYSLPGYESRHNSVYWTGGEYIGFGLGASSYFKGERFSNITDIETYNRICEDVREAITGNADPFRLYESAASRLRASTETMYVDSRIEEYSG